MMLSSALVILSLAVGVAGQTEPAPVLKGVVVNGTHGKTPLANAEVVLRGGSDNALAPLAKTLTDERGCFEFRNVAVTPGFVYLPGANHDGVHFPGPRLLLVENAPAPEVELTVYDAVSSPSPLIASEHEIDVAVKSDFVEITETMNVENPSLRTYVGLADKAPLTLKLSIPRTFERVTFHNEFHGRRFEIGEHGLTTGIPWPPGKRELHFTYQLPIEKAGQVFERVLDLPTARLRLHIAGLPSVECNLPRTAGTVLGGFVFEAASALREGFKVNVQSRGLTMPWAARARWIGLGVLAALVGATVILARMRKRHGEPAAAGACPSAKNRRRRLGKKDV